MNNLEKEARLALEALEELIKKTSGQAIYSFMETERRIALSACVGLREALAEQPEPDGVGGCAMCGAAYEDQVIPQPAQSCVACEGNPQFPNSPCTLCGCVAEEPAQQQEPVGDVGLLEYKGNSVAYIHQKMKAYRNGIDAAWDAMRAKGFHPDGKTSLADMIAKYTSPPASKPLTDGLTDREQSIIRFALYRFMADAYLKLNAAAQDKENRRFKDGDAGAFAKDAKDAEALLGRLTAAHGIKEKNT